MPLLTHETLCGKGDKIQRTPAEALQMLNGYTLNIEMQVRGIDTIGESDLLFYKYLFAHEGSARVPYPTLCNFCIDRTWKYSVSRSEYPDAIEFVDGTTGYTTITHGPIPFQSLYSGRAVNWILGTYFRLEGIRFRSMETDTMVRLGGMESSSALIGAATAIGSILSGENHDLGTIFTLATSIENDVLKGLTGGEGFAAGILGGANALTFPVHLHPYGAVARKLFDSDRYVEFENHVSILLPGGKKRKRSSIDINKEWLNDALSAEGRRRQCRIAALSAQVSEAYSSPGGIDWIQIATAVQEETEIRLSACSHFFDGIGPLAKALVVRDGKNVLRAVTRPGAGGWGTPITVFSATEELTEEARALVGKRIDNITADEFRLMEEIPKGWISYKISSNPIQFTGFEECGFTLPASPIQINE